SATTYTFSTAVSASLSSGQSFTNFNRLVGGGSDTVIGPNLTTAWVMTGANTGVLTANGLTMGLSGVANVTGGSGNDSFQFRAGASLSGTLDGGAGSNTLDYSLYGSNVTVNLASAAATALNGGLSSGFAHIQSLLGNQGTSGNQLVGPATATTYTLSSATVGSLSSGQSFSNFQILAGGGSDTLIGSNLTTAWVVTGPNSGTLTAGSSSLTFSGIKNATGGSGNDSFQFQSAGSLSGLLDGGAGSNTLDYSLYGSGVSVNLASGAATGIGTVKHFQTVLGSAYADALTADANNDTLAAGGGADTLSAGSGGGNHTFVLASTQAAGTSITGGSGSDTLVGPNGANTWTISGVNSGTVDGWAFASVANLTGGSGNDAFKFSGSGSLSGKVDGGAGVNTLDYSGYGSNVTVNLGSATATGISGVFAHVQSFLGNQGTSGNQLIGPVSTTTYTLSSATAGTLSSGQSFSNFQILAGSGSDTLIGPNLSALWTVSAANGGSLNAGGFILAFSGVGGLVGGSNSDTFKFSGSGSLSGKVDGGAGVNTLDYSGYGSNVTVNLGSATATGISGGFAHMQNFVGSSAASRNVLYGPTAATTYTFSTAVSASLSSGQSFTNFNRLVGGGSDTMIGPNLTTAWVMTGANSGVLTANGLTMGFSGVANVTGGSGNDSFQFRAGSSLSGKLDGGQGSNWLDYSLLTTGVTVNLTTGTAADVTGTVSNIQNVLGSSGNDSLTGNSSGGVLVGNGGNDFIQGGSGRSILIGGLGNDTVQGGSNDDIVIGGRTNYDINEVALLALLAEWQNPNDSFTTRVTNLQNGVGTSNVDKLIWGSTVLDDGGANILTGDATTASPGSLDWFFANLAAGHDTITDLTTGEKVNNS
ncbi:MAG TPA: hypothetical protein VFA18_10330, partial [Gemmataceae bacterium]|nr:hypothetical protein [Gemmataceae bacterium]